MMTELHTPTPWHHTGKATLRGADGDYIATLENNGRRAGNAAFIVRAVNAHDELVAALKEAIGELNDYAEDRGGEIYNNPRFNAILLKAEGQL